MPIISTKNAAQMCSCFALFKALKYMKVSRKVSVFTSCTVYGYFADKDHLQFLCPLILSPFISPQIAKTGYSKHIYSLAMAYICKEWCYDHDMIGNKFRIFLDANCGLKRDILKEFRKEMKEFGWVSKEFTHTSIDRTVPINCLKKLSINIGKITVFQILVQIFLTIARKPGIIINLEKHLRNWTKTVLFLFSVFQIGIQGPVQYNKYIHLFTNNETDIEKYKPKYWMVYVCFVIAAFIGIQIQSKKKQHFVAAYCLVQAIITFLNQYNVNI